MQYQAIYTRAVCVLSSDVAFGHIGALASSAMRVATAAMLLVLYNTSCVIIIVVFHHFDTRNYTWHDYALPAVYSVIRYDIHTFRALVSS